MKLAPAQVERVEERIECQALPEDHAATPQLETVFGDHTLFLDSEGSVPRRGTFGDRRR